MVYKQYIVGKLNQASAAESDCVLPPVSKVLPMPTNDNDPAMRGATLYPTDPHGHAALLLVESLLHGLCENATLTVGQAVEITERAADVQSDQAEEADGAAAPLWRSHALLTSIAASLRIDFESGPTPPRLVR